eukprot:9863888-Prorocentrum_lima.AAC.1
MTCCCASKTIGWQRCMQSPLHRQTGIRAWCWTLHVGLGAFPRQQKRLACEWRQRSISIPRSSARTSICGEPR